MYYLSSEGGTDIKQTGQCALMFPGCVCVCMCEGEEWSG